MRIPYPDPDQKHCWEGRREFRGNSVDHVSILRMKNENWSFIIKRGVGGDIGPVQVVGRSREEGKDYYCLPTWFSPAPGGPEQPTVVLASVFTVIRPFPVPEKIIHDKISLSHSVHSQV